ncbi:MAG: PAS domain S-box protein, partial [Leptolyngbyaceae bacterium]|nr:PAS domain S-box protein [Leptolyngbyaceae bacterium]
MPSLLDHLLFSKEFIPHGHCYLWKPGLVWLHVISDLLIAIAYYSIPISLFYVVRKRRDLPFNWMFLLFSSFIVACGTTHLMGVWTLWHPTYWLSGSMKLVTATVSLYTAGQLLNLVPQVLELPSPAQLEAANQELKQQINERQQVEEERRTLSLALENAVEGIAQLDIDGRYVAVNGAYASRIGYTPEEMIGMDWQLTVHALDLERMLLAYQQMLANGKVEVEARGICKDGSVFYKQLVMVTSYDSQKNRTGHYCFMKDVTERKQMEEVLQKEREFLNAVLETVEDGIVACDAEGILVLFNRAARELHGLPAMPLPAEQWAQHYDLYLPDGKALMSREEIPLFRAFQGELLRNVELVIAPNQGSVRSLLSSGRALFDSEGRKLGAVVSMHDITELKQAEVARQQYTLELQQALDFEALLKRITDKVRDSLDESQILQTVVEELGQGLGVKSCHATLYDLEQQTATLCYEYTTSAHSFQSHVFSMRESPEIYSQLLRGEYFQRCTPSSNSIQDRVGVLACPIFDHHGVIGDLHLINERDYGERDYGFKDSELRLVQQIANQCAIAIRQARLYRSSQAQVKALEQLNHLKDDFLSTVSHELRTPMSSIKMAVHMLEYCFKQEGGFSSSPEKVARYFRILQEECQREISLINNLLDLSRLDQAFEPLSVTQITLQAWIPNLLQPFVEQTQNQQQSLTVEIPADLPTLITDPSILSRILTELLNNACKYTPPSGVITVKAHRVPEKLVLSVSNSGVEIPASERDRIFDKFYRIPNGDPWKHGGTGLGLALVKRLAEQLGGTIQVASGGG